MVPVQTGEAMENHSLARRAPHVRRARLLVVGVAFLAACATNPVTGKKQLVLISEAQEIDMGRAADKDVVSSIGLYPDDGLQKYVQALGSRIAATTERPGLPWTFRVVDDASVNAFAIPGGFVYVTRGILTHLNSEAELTAILGHEIGHVTARHSVSQMSKQQLVQVGLVAGTVLSPDFARFGDLAQTGLGLLFLKFSRSDEAQADQLGFKYMLAGGYDPRKMENVFRMLQGVTRQAESGGRLPQWMSSHPDPENREAWAVRTVAGLNRDLSGLAVNRPAYLRRVDGMVFGENPREGLFQGTSFRHPDLAFRIDFPAGWKGINQKQAVAAESAKQDAVVVLQLAAQSSARAAAEKFFTEQGVVAGEPWARQVGGFPTVGYAFRAQSDQTALRGLAAWVEYQGRVYQLLGYATEQRWPDYESAVANAIGSFRRETDPAVLNVKPFRLGLVQLTRQETLDALLKDYPSTVSPQVVALINDLQGAAAVPAGDSFKRVTGGPGSR
jgi:predicted Zn-dependent protease